jgi:hypothetical protein
VHESIPNLKMYFKHGSFNPSISSTSHNGTYYRRPRPYKGAKQHATHRAAGQIAYSGNKRINAEP